jgi:hypothetical protein
MLTPDAVRRLMRAEDAKYERAFERYHEKVRTINEVRRYIMRQCPHANRKVAYEGEKCIDCGMVIYSTKDGTKQ